MRLLFSTALVFLSFQASAAIHVNMELQFEGKRMAPGVKVNAGETAEITQDDVTIQVKAEEKEGSIASIDVKVTQKEDNKERLVTNSNILTKFGKPAEVTQGKKGDKNQVRLKVVPIRVVE